jgi:hypothetical protein
MVKKESEMLRRENYRAFVDIGRLLIIIKSEIVSCCRKSKSEEDRKKKRRKGTGENLSL